MLRTPDALVARLDSACTQALDAALAQAAERGVGAVDVEHLLARLAEGKALRRYLGDFGVDGARVVRALDRAVKRDARPGRRPTLGRALVRVLGEAWMFASLELNAERIGAGPILLAARTLPDVRDRLLSACSALSAVDPDALRAALPRRTKRAARAAKTAVPEVQPAPSGALATYATDLTAKARAGGIDPIIGRDREIRQVVDILARRRQNNPILVGEAGVGKTAVVEGLARRIADDDVPPILADVELWALDLAALQAGASLQGEFEQRLEACIAEARSRPVVLFIDEAHTLIGAGGSEGRGDAANLLKPALARGMLRTVAATTWAEYKEHIEPDAALTRRFQTVRVDEPAPDVAVAMLRALAPTLEAHHGVPVLDEALDAAVKLSLRYVAGRRLPDKAIAVLDTACARVSLGQRATPAPVEEATRRVERMAAEVDRLEREAAGVEDHRARLAALIPALEDARTTQAELTDRWQAEKAIAERILYLGRQLADDVAPDPEKARSELRRERESLELLQSDRPMVPLQVDRAAVAAVIADWTGIPAGEMSDDARQALLRLPRRLAERIIGQSHAIDAIVRRLQSAGAGLDDPRRPLGVFLLAGPSGVGKTETAHALADTMFGGSDALVVINLSEYQEAHAVSGLKGAPPGYVGYGRGGVLTEAVRRRPYSVVLLDEIEKAHPDVIELFYQVFDKGTLEDGQGVPVDFRNTLVLATSNAADDAISMMPSESSVDRVVDAIMPSLREHFPAAFLGRLTVVPYRPLGPRQLQRIAGLKLGAVARRFAERHDTRLDWGPEVLDALVDPEGASHAGARTLDQRIEGRILPRIARAVLSADEGIGPLRIRVGDDGRFTVVAPGSAGDRAPRPPARHAISMSHAMPSVSVVSMPGMPSESLPAVVEVSDTAIVSAVAAPMVEYADDEDEGDDHDRPRSWWARLFGGD